MNKKKTILIAEDEQNISDMYKLSLEQAGFKTVVAQNGQEVLELTGENNPDLILLDINMPIKDGFEVLRDITEKMPLYRAFSKIPIIMLSNYSNPQDIDFCMKRGAQEYLVKSDFTPAGIVKKVKGYLQELDKIR